MESFDDRLKPENVKNFEQYKVEHYLHFVRQEVSEFLFNNIDKSYFDFTKTFEKLQIEPSDKKIRQDIINTTISELKTLGWCIASIFGDTSIVIMTSEETMSKCLWKSSFDFKRM